MLDGLNELQKSAVLASDGPLLIVAGPGTGKTRTLTHRIAYLIRERGIPPDNILAVTFTRKAAREMRDRLKRLLEIDIEVVNIGTIHSICLRILMREGHHLGINPDFSITDLLNFDDLISLTVELFEKYPDILKGYRDQYQHILIDEYQDIDRNQRRLMALLAGDSGNIFVIGDPDQAIYSFRGANVENFLLFEKDYPKARLIKFQRNYRSTQTIVSASDEVIKKNRCRIDKPLQACKDGGDKVQVYTVHDEGYEGRLIINEIERLIGATSHYSLYKRGDSPHFAERGYKFSDFAVLFRLNAQIRRAEEAFIDSGMPYQAVGGKRSIAGEEIRAALSYLHIIDNPEDDPYILHAINIPNRRLGPQSIAEIREKAKSLNLSVYELISRHMDRLLLNKAQKEGVRDFLNLIGRLRREVEDTSISRCIKKIIIDSGLIDFYGEEQPFSDLISIAVQYDDYPHGLALRSFLDDMELSSDIDYFDERADAVTLMTIHASKGLEFRVVFICGVEDGLIPYTLYHDKPLDSDEGDPEEERRLFYVGMTRAIERLYLINARERFLFGKKVTLPHSPFISEIPENLKEIYNINRPTTKKGISDKMEKQMRLF